MGLNSCSIPSSHRQTSHRHQGAGRGQVILIKDANTADNGDEAQCLSAGTVRVHPSPFQYLSFFPYLGRLHLRFL